MNQESEIISTELVKIKVQATFEDIEEFKNRLKPFLPKMDCFLIDESPSLKNARTRYYRNYLRIGLNRRVKDNGE